MEREKMSNPHCPYCGTVMVFDGRRKITCPMGTVEYAGYFGRYICPECDAQAPSVWAASKLEAIGSAAVMANKRYQGEGCI